MNPPDKPLPKPLSSQDWESLIEDFQQGGPATTNGLHRTYSNLSSTKPSLLSSKKTSLSSFLSFSSSKNSPKRFSPTKRISIASSNLSAPLYNHPSTA
ncbi:hypothetical protein NC651_019150 [Populus alba x Populus x berolinensis]|nr:hypothetical protein NC651_019150 [Populus alba x Populus x berolinensis]